MDTSSGDIDGLRVRPLGELQHEWGRRLNTPPPELRSADVLARMLAWRIQEREHGGMDPNTKTRLRRLARAFDQEPGSTKRSRTSLTPGTTLVREWQGGTHHVRVTEKGFEYAGDNYRSLSEVARTITGARWSGPRFFGLSKKADRRVTV